MGLKIYVGSLTRYLSGEGNPRASLQPTGAALTRQAVLRWRKELARTLTRRLEWDEDAGASHFTDKPGWDAHLALVTWAAYAEHPAHRRPVHFTPGQDLDPLVQVARQSPQNFPHLLLNVELWLPTEHPAVYWTDWPLNHRRSQTGSLLKLQHELELLNHLTWKASPSQIESWTNQTPDHAKLDGWARFGFAVLAGQVSRAAQHKLPMLLDY